MISSASGELRCFFASDLHGRPDSYRKLFAAILDEKPRAVFLGGDLLPHSWATAQIKDGDFIVDTFEPMVRGMLDELGADAPRLFVILGNDDDRACEKKFLDGQHEGLWSYAHKSWTDLENYRVLGYSCVPPTPFLLKDWERYDVSRFTDPGSLSPEEGQRTVAVDPDEVRHGTIAKDLENLTTGRDFEYAVVLFHSPPYGTDLDRAELDGRMVDHVPLDVHVGSIAIQRWIEAQQPLLTLHGHIHESTRLTGSWRQQFGRTHAFNAAHDGPELALVRFDLRDLESATRELV